MQAENQIFFWIQYNCVAWKCCSDIRMNQVRQSNMFVVVYLTQLIFRDNCMTYNSGHTSSHWQKIAAVDFSVWLSVVPRTWSNKWRWNEFANLCVKQLGLQVCQSEIILHTMTKSLNIWPTELLRFKPILHCYFIQLLIIINVLIIIIINYYY